MVGTFNVLGVFNFAKDENFVHEISAFDSVVVNIYCRRLRAAAYYSVTL